ncbi:MAG: STAS/SEC14 domain-containing protein [Bacteroidota bacterium]
MEAAIISVKNALGNDLIQIEYDEANGWLYTRWIGDLTVEDVETGGEKMLEQVKEKSCQKVLNDNRDVIGSWDEANEWIAQNWMPRALAAGLKKFAHVISPDIFSALSAEEMITQVNGFEMRIFEDEEEAKSWLRS